MIGEGGNMKLRKSTTLDIDPIMSIIGQAQRFLKEIGIDQWQNNYPNIETIESDIENGYSYVLIKDSVIIGTVAVSFDGEKTYDTIYDGKWISNGPYAVVHRMAVNDNFRGKGIGRIIIQNIENMALDNNVKSIKIDTHRGNLPMQNMLKNCGFQYCGIIYLEDGNERLAFEKTLT